MTEAGEAALKRFHEWCRAEGVTYDEEVSSSRDTNPDQKTSIYPSRRPPTRVLPHPSTNSTDCLRPTQAVDIATHADGTMGVDRYHYAVYAKRDLAVDTPVVTAIPKAACLSARTCSVAETLKAARLGGGLALNIAILHERSLGERSRWAGYFAVLPAKGERTLPMFWTDRQLQTLQGTDLLKHVTDDATCMAEDFQENVVDGLCVSHPRDFPPGTHTLEAYMEAASLAASRAFFIGDECGEALVPWADMFNHKTDGEHVHVLGADDEEDLEGEEETSESEEEESEEEEEEEEESTDTEEIIEPITGSLVIHVCAAAQKGAELFNTFGRQNNASLLHKYGFCEPHNAYTNVCIDAQLVETIVGGTKVRDAAAELGVELETEPYFEIEPDGHIEEALLAVLGRAHRATDATDDPTTESPEVQTSLREILERRMGIYDDGRETEGDGEEGGGVPAGGGLVGAAAARTLRDAERRLLRLAIERNCGGGKKRKKVD